MLEDRSALLADNPSQWYSGLAVADLDGDGNFECYAAARGGRNLVLKWGGDAFYDVAIAPLTATSEPSMGVAAGDADGDGREELFVSSSEGAPDRLFAWRNGAYRDLLADPKRQSSQSVLAFDRFGMGRYGFLVAHEGGPFRYYEIHGGDRVVELGAELGLACIAGGRSLLAAPLLGNQLEIYAGNEGISNMLFRPTTTGTFHQVAASHGLASEGYGLAVIDANADGRLDLLTGAQLRLQGTQGMFSTLDLAPATTHARTVLAADFDNDGYEELFIAIDGGPSLFYAWRDGDWRAQPLQLGHSIHTAAVGDWNHDGRLELLLAPGGQHPGPLELYQPHPNRNHWLRVAPLTALGAPARGATVQISANGQLQTRIIDNGSGYLSQHEPIAHFGLGVCDHIDWLEVTWPDGAQRRIKAPATCRTLRLQSTNTP